MPPTAMPETSVTPPGSVRSSFRPGAEDRDRNAAGDLQQPGVLDRAGVLDLDKPADHVVVPFSRNVWPARRNRWSMIVVCEPALNAVVPESEKLLDPSDDWPPPTVSVPSPRRVPSPAMRSAPVCRHHRSRGCHR